MIVLGGMSIGSLLFHQFAAAIALPEQRLFDFPCGVPGHRGKDDLPGPLVPGQLLAELVDLFLGAGLSLLHLDDVSLRLLLQRRRPRTHSGPKNATRGFPRSASRGVSGGRET